MNIKISSPKGTPTEDILFVLEYPASTRIKMRMADVDQELGKITKEKDNLNKREIELDEIKKAMNVELKK